MLRVVATPVRALARRPWLIALLGVHAAVSLLIWLSGSALGVYALGCQVGTIADALTGSMNPHMSIFDYYDSWTAGYLLSGLLAAPFELLPWRTIYSVEAGALVANGAILVLAWAWLERSVGLLAARIGCLALVLIPPVARHHSLIGPQYHYTELLFNFAMPLLWAEIVLHGRRSAVMLGTFGLVCGLSLSHSFGSAAYLGVVVLLWMITDRGWWRRPSAWAAMPAALVGLWPLLYKGLLHRPYGTGEPSLRGFGYSHASGAMPSIDEIVGKLLRLVGYQYGDALGLIDALEPVIGLGWAYAWSRSVGWVTLLALVAVLVLGWRGVEDGFRSFVPGERGRLGPEGLRAVAAVVPAACVVAFLLAYLTSGVEVSEFDLGSSQPRSDRFLVPLTALLALNLGVLVQLVQDRWGGEGRRRRWLVGATAAGLAAILVPCAWGQVRMIDGPGLRDTEGIPYRGRCWSVESYYAIDVLAGDTGAAARLCGGFPPEGVADCYRGFAWSVGIRLLEDSEAVAAGALDFELPASVAAACDALGAGWDRDCYRQIGWLLQFEGPRTSRFRGGSVAAVAEWCKGMPDEARMSWCIEGAGFFAGDHYGSGPWKIETLMPERQAGAAAQQATARGVGYVIAHMYELRGAAERRCQGYGAIRPDLGDACREGLEEGYSVYERVLPAGAVPE